MLRERLKAAEDGDVAAVREAAQKDADRLSQLPFGAPMLHLIGCAVAPARAAARSHGVALCPLVDRCARSGCARAARTFGRRVFVGGTMPAHGVCIFHVRSD